MKNAVVATRARAVAMLQPRSFVLALAGLAVISLAAAATMPPATDAEKAAIDSWIKETGRNKWGDAAYLMYAGGSPLFDESTGEMTDLYDYVRTRHKDSPWDDGAPGEDSKNTKSAAAKEDADAEEDSFKRNEMESAAGSEGSKQTTEEEESEDSSRKINGKSVPNSWGDIPLLQTRDYRPLPGGQGLTLVHFSALSGPILCTIPRKVLTVEPKTG